MLKKRGFPGWTALALVAALAAGPASAAASSACDLCALAYRGELDLVCRQIAGFKSCQPVHWNGDVLHLHDDLGKVQQLLEHGADVRATYEGVGPIGFMLAKDRVDVALLLLRHGADPNSANPGQDYLVPLKYAVQRRDLELTAALIQAGANEANETSALFALTQSSDHSGQYAEILQMLLDAGPGTTGADVNEVGDTGWTPLDNLCAYAASAPDTAAALSLVKALLYHGANPDARAMIEALELAKNKGDPSLIALLLAYGGRIDPKDSAEFLNAVRSRPELLPRLVDAGAIVDQEGEGNAPVLYVALRAGDVEAVKQLLALGAAPNPDSGLGPGFSQLVVQNPPDPEMVRAVMEAGLDIGVLFFEPGRQITSPPSIDDINKTMFPGFLPDSQALLDRLIRERYAVLSGMSRYFAPPHGDLDHYDSLYDKNAHPAVAAPAPGSIPLSEYQSWLAAAPDYLAAPNAQAAFFAASKGLPALPPIPEAAREHARAGRALYAKAVTPTGALAAAAEYEAAARLAPWVGAYHRNLCVLYDLGGALVRAYEQCVIYESGAPADLPQIKQRSDAIATRIKNMLANQGSS